MNAITCLIEKKENLFPKVKSTNETMLEKLEHHLQSLHHACNLLESYRGHALHALLCKEGDDEQNETKNNEELAFKSIEKQLQVVCEKCHSIIDFCNHPEQKQITVSIGEGEYKARFDTIERYDRLSKIKRRFQERASIKKEDVKRRKQQIEQDYNNIKCEEEEELQEENKEKDEEEEKDEEKDGNDDKSDG